MLPCAAAILSAFTQLDPEFTASVDVIRSGMFGYEDFFSDVLDSITHGSDYYLLANDFQSYIQAQVTTSQMQTCFCRWPYIGSLAPHVRLLVLCKPQRKVGRAPTRSCSW